MSTKKFDETAFTYDCKPMHVERAKSVANAIKRNVSIKNNWKIADFGCGTGLLGLNFVNDVNQIDMIDTSINMLNVLQNKIQKSQLNNITTKLMDITNDAVPIEEYDMIITLMTFHHIENLKYTVKQLYKMLKWGGFLAIADLDEEDGTYHQDGNTVHNGINQKMLQKLAKESGLKLIKTSIPYVIKKKVKNLNREYPVFLHIYKKEKDNG